MALVTKPAPVAPPAPPTPKKATIADLWDAFKAYRAKHGGLPNLRIFSDESGRVHDGERTELLSFNDFTQAVAFLKANTK